MNTPQSVLKNGGGRAGGRHSSKGPGEHSPGGKIPRPRAQSHGSNISTVLIYKMKFKISYLSEESSTISRSSRGPSSSSSASSRWSMTGSHHSTQGGSASEGAGRGCCSCCCWCDASACSRMARWARTREGGVSRSGSGFPFPPPPPPPPPPLALAPTLPESNSCFAFPVARARTSAGPKEAGGAAFFTTLTLTFGAEGKEGEDEEDDDGEAGRGAGTAIQLTPPSSASVKAQGSKELDSGNSCCRRWSIGGASQDGALRNTREASSAVVSVVGRNRGGLGSVGDRCSILPG